jgi:CRISPR-associated protein Cas5d
MTSHRIHTLRVWGDFACFTRPEMKVERFSYPAPTPSAARGILDAIYCKPNARDPDKTEFRWQVVRVDILKPIQYIALRRNEVKEYANVTAIQKWMKGTANPVPIFTDADKEFTGTDMKGRTQRQTMALREVEYQIHARIVPWPKFDAPERRKSFDEQFQRRASQGKCFTQPAFGCREFPAYFEYGGCAEAPPSFDNPAKIPDQDLGWMLYDVFDLSKIGSSNSPQAISLFRAEIINGSIKVPDYDSPDVRKPREEVA